MKFRIATQLCIIGLIFLASASAYADNEDILTISPPEGGGPGIYEITISGVRDYEPLIVRDYEADIRVQDCQYLQGVYGCGASVTVKASISPGQNPALGRSTYQKKFKIFLESRMYYLHFLIEGEGDEYESGTVRMPPNYYCQDSYGCKFNMLIVNTKPSINLSIQNATAEVSGTDSFTLRNVAAEMGTGEKFGAWGTFRWNPSS